MANPSKKRSGRTSAAPSPLDEARDELFSHILRCGVLEADPEHQKEWMDDTMQYLAERYPELTEEQVDYMTQRIPMRRTGTPDEIAAVVHFLASPDCSFVTGQCYDASGGRATY